MASLSDGPLPSIIREPLLASRAEHLRDHRDIISIFTMPTNVWAVSDSIVVMGAKLSGIKSGVNIDG